MFSDLNYQKICCLFVCFVCFVFFFVCLFVCLFFFFLGPDLREGMESPKAFCLKVCGAHQLLESSRTWFPLTVEGNGPFLDRGKKKKQF